MKKCKDCSCSTKDAKANSVEQDEPLTCSCDEPTPTLGSIWLKYRLTYLKHYIKALLYSSFNKFRFFVLRLLFPMNSRTSWAYKELDRAGMIGKDSEAYGGMIATACLDLYRVMSAQGHSGFSNSYTLEIFNMLRKNKQLSPLTNDPDEWTDVAEYFDGKPFHQSKRNCSCFSDDNLITYYDVDERKKIKGKYKNIYYKLMDHNEIDKSICQGVP